MQMIFRGITMDPGVRFGKPCVAGTRVDVATVVGAIGAGDTVEAVQEAYDPEPRPGPRRRTLRDSRGRSSAARRPRGLLTRR